MLQKGQLPILVVNLIAITFFSIIFLVRKNYEFVLYVLVILFFGILILATNKKVRYPNDVLWGLSLWAFLHMAGGGLTYNGTRWYEIIFLDIVGPPYEVLKYDQVIHAIGFFVATLIAFHLLKGALKKDHGWIGVGIVIVMAGLGFGALNEIVEFFVSVIVPQSGVGGYENTSLDLIANLIGAIIAFFWIYAREKKG